MAEGTFWKEGDRVVARFWEPGEPFGTVKSAKIVTDRVYENAFDETGTVKTFEVVMVLWDGCPEGSENEEIAWELRRVPEGEGRG